MLVTNAGMPTQYYDSFTLNPDQNVLEIPFFCNAVGMGGSTYATTNLQRPGQFNSDFLVDGIVLHCDNALLWNGAYFDFCVNRRLRYRVNTKVSRLTGQVDILDTGVLFVDRNETIRGEMIWPRPVTSPDQCIITVILVGRTFPNDPNLVLPKTGVFARVLVGDELSDKSGILTPSAQTRDINLGAAESLSARKKVVSASPSVIRKFNFED